MPTNIDISQPLAITPQCEVKNRLMKSAMSEQLADAGQRNPNEKLFRLYRAWAEGGTGLIVTGNVMIDRTAIGEIRNVALDQQSDLQAFRNWAEAGGANGAQFWMQLCHPGKQVPNFLSKEPVAPSAVPLGAGLEKAFNTPRALEEQEIHEIIGKFAWAAKTARECGFTGVQIHGAHGYLVNQFLSPHHNRRVDRWGGSLENRMRFVRRVYEMTREAVGPDFPIGIKLNSADFQRGGFTEEESIEVMKTLEADGIDMIEVSGGNYESPSMVGSGAKESTIKREAYFLEYAEKAKAVLSIPVAVTGGFRSAAAMNDALGSGALDMIGLARPLAVDPELSNKLLADPGHRIEVARPSTGIAFLDQMTMLDITWFEHQIERIATGKPVDMGRSPWRTVFKVLGQVGGHVLAPRRA